MIPVAKAMWDFGGGIGQTEPGEAGNGHEHGASLGSGGGGAVMMSPVGYIELANGRARFRPIVGISALVPLVAAVGVAVVLIARGLRRRCCQMNRSRR